MLLSCCPQRYSAREEFPSDLTPKIKTSTPLLGFSPIAFPTFLGPLRNPEPNVQHAFSKCTELEE